MRTKEDIKAEIKMAILEGDEAGIYCVAAPIYDYMGEVIAAISVGDTNKQFIKATNKQIEFIKQTAREISKRLGYLE